MGLKVREAQEGMSSMDQLASCSLPKTAWAVWPGKPAWDWARSESEHMGPASEHSLLSSVTLGKSLALSEAQFPLQ